MSFLEEHLKLMTELKSQQALELWWKEFGSPTRAAGSANDPRCHLDRYKAFLDDEGLRNKHFGLPNINVTKK